MKANGEAAHLAARKINGKYIIFGGSKNVHMAFSNRGTVHTSGTSYASYLILLMPHTILDNLYSHFNAVPNIPNKVNIKRSL